MYLIFDLNGNLIQSCNKKISSNELNDITKRMGLEIGCDIVGTMNENICEKAKSMTSFKALIERNAVIDVELVNVNESINKKSEIEILEDAVLELAQMISEVMK